MYDEMRDLSASMDRKKGVSSRINLAEFEGKKTKQIYIH